MGSFRSFQFPKSGIPSGIVRPHHEPAAENHLAAFRRARPLDDRRAHATEPATADSNAAESAADADARGRADRGPAASGRNTDARSAHPDVAGINATRISGTRICPARIIDRAGISTF